MPWHVPIFYFVCVYRARNGSCHGMTLFYFFDDSLEGFGMIHCQVGKCFPV